MAEAPLTPAEQAELAAYEAVAKAEAPLTPEEEAELAHYESTAARSNPSHFIPNGLNDAAAHEAIVKASQRPTMHGEDFVQHINPSFGAIPGVAKAGELIGQGASAVASKLAPVMKNELVQNAVGMIPGYSHVAHGMKFMGGLAKMLGKSAPGVEAATQTGAREIAATGLDAKVGLEALPKFTPRTPNADLTEALAMETRATPALEAMPKFTPKAPNPEISELLATESRSTPALEFAPKAPRTSSGINPELQARLAPEPPVELLPAPPTAPRSGPNGPSLQDILKYAESQTAPATEAVESTLATALKPKSTWSGPKLQRRGVE